MKFSTLFLSAATAVALLVAPSCKKKDDADPTFGSISYNGQNVGVISVVTQEVPPLFQMVASGESGNKTYALTYQSVAGKPASGDADASTSVVTLTILDQSTSSSETHYYVKSGEKVTAATEGGKLKLSATNLSETERDGSPVASGKAVSFSVTQE